MGNCTRGCLNPSLDEEACRMEQERTKGQALLRAMVMKDTRDIDWAAVITKANELHTKEQLWLKQGGRQRRWRQKRALQQRRRYEAVGSFGVNMITYRLAESDKQALSVGSKDETHLSNGSSSDHSDRHTHEGEFEAIRPTRTSSF